MNLTELARVLRVSPQELRNILPLAGFHIGHRAIKVDNKTARKIMKEWPNIKRQQEAKQKAEEAEIAKEKENEVIEIKKVSVPRFISVRDFAELTEIPISKVLAELMKSGVFTSMNEKIDFDTAAIIGEDLNLEVSLDESIGNAKNNEDEKNKLKNTLEKEEEDDLLPRPPIIVVMGHVDHGKTKLLDAVRKTDVVAGEAGGITQHIGAYQVTRNKKIITFIDTPGHEAFTAMRSRGAKVADIAILVVAADDGVKPQTIEAFNIIKAAKIPYLVAINKIDKEEADVNKTKQEVSSQLNITPEDWGGKTICAPISAIKGTGIEELLDMVLLTADMESKNMKANPEAKAMGTVIESHVDKGEGPVATIVVQNGTVKLGDNLSFNNQAYGKIRTLKNYKGETIKEAGPSVPVKLIGLKIAPTVGDILEEGLGGKVKVKKIKSINKNSDVVKTTSDENEDSKIKKINLIIKSDFLGSAEAIEESLEKINTEDIKAKIVHKGLGNITEGDIEKAEATESKILGFHVKISPQAENLARDKKVTIKLYDIIYDLINDIKEEIAGLFEATLIREDLGRLKVAAIFRTEPKSQIVGGKVLDGVVQSESNIEVMRDSTIDETLGRDMITEGKLIKLQSAKQDVKEVEAGQECGILYEGEPVVKVDDILQFYKMVKKK